MIDIFKLKTTELKALVCYKDVMEKNKHFPKDFWTEEKNQQKGIKVKCRIVTRFCLENLAHIEASNLPKYYMKQIKEVLIKHQLFGMVQTVFNHDILSLLKNAYPDEFKNKLLRDWQWSKHGIWHDDKAIIEAVQDMVYKEGIRWIKDIPTLDWKKRLIKHGIYNVLAYFNWSIFALFNFVYPDKFHATDFKYKTKWAASESLQNAFIFMHKIFKKKKLSLDNIYLLTTADFRRMGLTAMLITIFESSTLRAKEYYLYKTIGDEEHQNEIKSISNNLLKERFDQNVISRLKKVANGNLIYNLHSNYTLYNFIKRHAKNNNKTIDKFIEEYGFIYKTAKKDFQDIDKDEVWRLRKNGMSYVQIAAELDSNPTTITKICNKYFGGDPLIPRPIANYTTVQELMTKYHVDHKTIMKLVNDNGFENHTTIRLRYLKKREIEPALKKYIKNSKAHISMAKRYSKSL
jgi:hypothetical protein